MIKVLRLSYDTETKGSRVEVLERNFKSKETAKAFVDQKNEESQDPEAKVLISYRIASL